MLQAQNRLIEGRITKIERHGRKTNKKITHQRVTLNAWDAR